MPDVKISPASIVIALAVILILGVFGWLTFGPRPAPPPPPILTAEAKEYLPDLALANVHMQASESMVNQRVVEILGDITNNGDRTVIKLAEVTCVFRDYYGNGADARARRRSSAARSATRAGANQAAFRLAFDDVANTWNQAMPTLVIAQIQFQ